MKQKGGVMFLKLAPLLVMSIMVHMPTSASALQLRSVLFCYERSDIERVRHVWQDNVLRGGKEFVALTEIADQDGRPRCRGVPLITTPLVLDQPKQRRQKGRLTLTIIPVAFEDEAGIHTGFTFITWYKRQTHV